MCLATKNFELPYLILNPVKADTMDFLIVNYCPGEKDGIGKKSTADR